MRPPTGVLTYRNLLPGHAPAVRTPKSPSSGFWPNPERPEGTCRASPSPGKSETPSGPVAAFARRGPHSLPSVGWSVLSREGHPGASREESWPAFPLTGMTVKRESDVPLPRLTLPAPVLLRFAKGCRNQGRGEPLLTRCSERRAGRSPRGLAADSYGLRARSFNWPPRRPPG